VVAIFVVRASRVECVSKLLMYRPIGTPAAPSGSYFAVFCRNIFGFANWLPHAMLHCSQRCVKTVLCIHFGSDSLGPHQRMYITADLEGYSEV